MQLLRHLDDKKLPTHGIKDKVLLAMDEGMVRDRNPTAEPLHDEIRHLFRQYVYVLDNAGPAKATAR